MANQNNQNRNTSRARGHEKRVFIENSCMFLIDKGGKFLKNLWYCVGESIEVI